MGEANVCSLVVAGLFVGFVMAMLRIDQVLELSDLVLLVVQMFVQTAVGQLLSDLTKGMFEFLAGTLFALSRIGLSRTTCSQLGSHCC